MKYLFLLFISIPIHAEVDWYKIGVYDGIAMTSDYEQVFQQIIQNKPSIDTLKAHSIAYNIVTQSKEYNVNPKLFAAILMQESSYNLSAKNCKDTSEGYEICTDYGISQIHYKTVKLYGFDKSLLTSDIKYSIKAGMKVLSDFKKRYGKTELHYWTRYNSPNPKARKKYQERVERWL